MSLPSAMTRNMPAVVHVIRRVVLEPPVKKLVWTDEDRVVQKQLKKMLEEREPPMQMVFDRTKTMNGRVVEERPGYVVFSEKLGDSGEVSLAISRDRIVRLEKREIQVPEITLYDVRFHREFENKRLYKRPPYTIITDEPYLAVGRMVEQQQKLYERFAEQLNPLITGSLCRNDMQLLIFSDAAEYEAYRSRDSVLSEDAVGFYNIRQGRLVVFHQRDADWVKEGRQKIAGVMKEQQSQAQTDDQLNHLHQWRDKARARLNARASAATGNILRHEGTHQLAYMLGVQNPVQSGRGWVAEGLATFFETERPGGDSRPRSAELAAALEGGRMTSLKEMIAAPRCISLLDYAQAWSLTRLLMQPEYKSGFFAYLDWLRNHPEPSADPAGELCRFLLLTPDELEPIWQTFIRKD